MVPSLYDQTLENGMGGVTSARVNFFERKIVVGVLPGYTPQHGYMFQWLKLYLGYTNLLRKNYFKMVYILLHCWVIEGGHHHHTSW